MAIGIKSTDLTPGLIKVEDALQCPDCNLVLGTPSCPLCAAATIPHPQREETPRYCMRCADEIQGQAWVIPWSHDPYIQDSEDGDLICCCPACKTKEEEDYV